MDCAVKVDKARHRVQLTLKGLFDDELTRTVADEVLAGMQQVKPGFYTAKSWGDAVKAFAEISK